jgi:hypothetical protein
MRKSFGSVEDAIQYVLDEVGAQTMALQMMVHALDRAELIDRFAYVDALRQFAAQDDDGGGRVERVEAFCQGIAGEDMRSKLSLIAGGKQD